MKKTAFLIALFMLSLFFSTGVSAESYSVSFDEEKSERLYSEYLNELPDDVREKLPDDEKYDARYFLSLLGEGFSSSLNTSLKFFLKLCGAVVISAVAAALNKSFIGGENRAFTFCLSLSSVLIIWRSLSQGVKIAGELLSSLSNIMLLAVPAMEGLLIYSGNTGSAAVYGTGMTLMITVCESMFSRILYPATVICFFLSAAHALSQGSGISFAAKIVRGFCGGILIALMALMTFALTLQNTQGAAADTFGARTLKFALSSYMPLVGSSISESFSCLAAGVSVVKQTLGVTGIGALLIVLTAPVLMLVGSRVSVGAAAAVAELLDCEREKNVLSQMGGVFTLLIAVCCSAGTMFIIAIGIFCKTVPAMS